MAARAHAHYITEIIKTSGVKIHFTMGGQEFRLRYLKDKKKRKLSAK